MPHCCCLAGMQSPAEISVFPKDKILEVGSRATFCCIVPEGKGFRRMYVNGYKGMEKKISEHVHALTVHLEQQSENWSDVICETTKGDISGASFHAGCKYEAAGWDDGFVFFLKIYLLNTDCWFLWFFLGICHKFRPPWWQWSSVWNPGSGICRLFLEYRKENGGTCHSQKKIPASWKV